MAIRTFIPTFVSNGVTSTVNLFITIVVGRQEGLYALGVFGVGFAFLGLVQLLARETGVNVAWATKNDGKGPSLSFTRAGLIAGIGAAIMIAVAMVLSSWMLGLIGVAVFGYSLYDFARLWEISEGRRMRVLATDVVLGSVVLLVGSSVLVLDLPALWLLASWAFLFPVLTFVLVRTWPNVVRRKGLRDRDGWSFGFQALMGSGSVHISTMLLAVLATPSLVGELRAATALFGAVNVITVTIQSVAIQSLVGVDDRRRVFVRWVPTTVALQTVLAVSTGMLSLYFGPLLFESSWAGAGHLIPWLALDVVLVSLSAYAVAAHKVDRAARNASLVATIVGLLRIVLVPGIGVAGNAVWVAMTLCCISGSNTLLWWVSYRQYRRGRKNSMRVNVKSNSSTGNGTM